MKKRNLIISTVLATSILSVGAIGVASACGGPGGGFGGKGHGNKMMHVVEKLDLSKEQRTSIWKIMDKQKDTMRANREEMYSIRTALRDAAGSENYDEDKVRELANKKASMMSNMIVQRTQSMNQIQKLLTQEQQDKFNELQDRSFGRGRF
ncbi:MAG: Spy/CpxP family protein refolding chaperone [Gammaproteobacteria bacterium]